MIRTILAEDHHLVRQGLRTLLEKEADIQVVAEADNGRDAVELAKTLKPDIVVMDLVMPEMDGALAARQIHTSTPDTRIIVLSMYGDESSVSYALQHDASGYIVKTTVIEELVNAIHSVHTGQTYLSPGLAHLVAKRVSRLNGIGFESPLDRLSSRERQVLVCIVNGDTSMEIAQKFSLSISTVEKHRLHVMEKLGIHDVPGLVRFAVRQGLTSIE